jgi:hypothetical protein
MLFILLWYPFLPTDFIGVSGPQFSIDTGNENVCCFCTEMYVHRYRNQGFGQHNEIHAYFSVI